MRPSYNTGFAKYAADSKYPELWRSLVGAWCPFLGNTGPTLLHDVSGRYNHGTLVNGPTWSASGKHGPALSLVAASTQYVDCGDADIIANATQMSFSIWLCPDFIQSTAIDAVVLDKQYTPRLWFRNASNDFRFQLDTSNGLVNVDTLGVTWTLGDWIHLAGTYDGSKLRIYFNGIFENDGNQTGTIEANNDDLLLGVTSDLNAYWDGKIGNLLFYDRALTPAEIGLLYRDPSAVFEYADIPYARVAVAAASMPVIMQQMNQFDGGTAL